MGSMKKGPSRAGMGRRQMLKRFAAGAGASAALPVLGRVAPADTPGSMPGMPMPEGQALGSAEPPDPALSAADWKPKFFDTHENETVIALSDLIIPDTETPGAKAARVNRLIDQLLSVETSEVQKQILQALGWLDGHCLSKFSKPFTGLQRAEQEEVLKLLTHESRVPQITYGVELFRMVKGSIVEAYYSSEIGTLQELGYQTNPFQTEFPGCKNPEEH